MDRIKMSLPIVGGAFLATIMAMGCTPPKGTGPGDVVTECPSGALSVIDEGVYELEEAADMDDAMSAECTIGTDVENGYIEYNVTVKYPDPGTLAMMYTGMKLVEINILGGLGWNIAWFEGELGFTPSYIDSYDPPIQNRPDEAQACLEYLNTVLVASVSIDCDFTL